MSKICVFKRARPVAGPFVSSALGFPVLVAGLLLASLFLAGCVQSTNQGPPITTGPAPREPKRLEARVTIDLAEFAFQNSAGAGGSSFSLPANKTVGIHVRNVGNVEHELLIGRSVNYEDGKPDGYLESLFADVPADVFVYMPQKVEVETGGEFEEAELEPQAELWIRSIFPEAAKGTWEIGCFVEGHYEAGMKATLVIE